MQDIDLEPGLAEILPQLLLTSTLFGRIQSIRVVTRRLFPVCWVNRRQFGTSRVNINDTTWLLVR